MFGRKTKRIEFLEERCKHLREQSDVAWVKVQKLENENTNLRLDNSRLRQEVGRLQTQVQNSLVRNTKGQFERIKK